MNNEHATAELASLLRRTNELLQTLVSIQLRSALQSELTDPKKRTLYDLTGCATPIKALAAKVGMGTGSISRTWQQWESLGLLVKDGKSYRRVLR
jgi:hypothetical protein